MNNTKKLPDSYAKSTDSNVYKLMQLVNLLRSDTRSDLKSIDEARDIQQAAGNTLDRYGETILVSRGGATDEQYRIKILSQIARSITECDCNSVIYAIANIFDVPATNISIAEGDMAVDILGLTIEMLDKSGYKSREIESMIKGVLPIGVEMSHPKYAGTLLIMPNDFKMSAYSETYPTLFPAWYMGWEKYMNKGLDVGLSGNGEVPEEWANIFSWTNKQTFEGGTLSILSDGRA